MLDRGVGRVDVVVGRRQVYVLKNARFWNHC